MSNIRRVSIHGVRTNPATVAAVVSLALKQFNKGANWAKGAWIKTSDNTPINGLRNVATPAVEAGKYNRAVKVINALPPEQKAKVCMCLEGSIGVAAAKLIPGFDKNTNQGKNVISAAFAAINDAAGRRSDTVLFEFNDDVTTTCADIEKAMRKAIASVRKLY